MRLLLYFFFSCSACPRDLHSFPTRRSSDLPAGRAGEPPSQALAESLKSFGFRWGRQNRTTSATDRKSTRLNSSHLGISYAVFCLKKKKNDTEQRTIAKRHTTRTTTTIDTQY